MNLKPTYKEYETIMLTITILEIYNTSELPFANKYGMISKANLIGEKKPRLTSVVKV
jgi:hypothetical protein